MHAHKNAAGNLLRQCMAWMWITVTCACVVTGCVGAGPRQGYDGPRLPSKQEAKITIQESSKTNFWQWDGEWCTIIELDGEYFNTYSGFATELFLLPGKHTIGVQWECKTRMTRNPIKLWLIAEAGQEYTVRFERRSDQEGRDRVHAWIENKATGKRVGGPVGSPDEPSG